MPLLTVDLADTADFMTYSDGLFEIEDLSSVDVPAGQFKITVNLSDGFDVVTNDITIIIYEAPVYEDESPPSE